jgi:hypothetical protein
MYYILIYDVVDNFIERRAVLREEHLKLVYEAHGGGAHFEGPMGAVCEDRQAERRRLADVTPFTLEYPPGKQGAQVHGQIID